MINFVLSVCNQKGKIALLRPVDLEYFSNLTTNKTIVMGYNTWTSKSMPIPNATVIVISNRENGYNGEVYFTTLDEFKYNLNNSLKNEEIYCIGGSKLFKTFMSDPELRPRKMYVTASTGVQGTSVQGTSVQGTFDTTHFEHYKLFAYSKEQSNYRILQYRITELHHEEHNYLCTMRTIIDTPLSRSDRTNVGVKSIFSNKIQFDISSSIPLMTTKSVSFKNILEELLWICRGETDSTVLRKKGVNIWNANTSEEFLRSRRLDYKEGELGPLYGFQMRNFGAVYGHRHCGFDQLKYVENLLKTDPFSRRIVITYINPPDYDKAVLHPCHNYIQFYVEEIEGKLYLSCFFNMRSSDFALASCYNIVSYSILTHVLAKRCGMLPKSIVYHAVDCHVYLNHIDQVREQLKRDLRPFPALEIDDSIVNKDWEDICYEDFALIGYFPNSHIKMSMAV